jgi:hypothetical protein
MKIVRVYLIINPMILFAEKKEVVSHGVLEDGDRVVLPSKLLENFLPEKDKDGAEFVMLSKEHLIKIEEPKQPTFH